MIKSRCGIVAALAFLCCCSQAEARTELGTKLMGDRPGAQGPEWVLYEELPEDGEIVSFNQAGDSEGAFEICQSEDGAVGNGGYSGWPRVPHGVGRRRELLCVTNAVGRGGRARCAKARFASQVPGAG